MIDTTYICSEAHPCDRPNHNHTSYRTPPPVVCANCHRTHHTWQCPEIYALLFAPVRYLCDDCGDPINHDGVCPACQEVAAVDRLLVAGMVRDAFGISLDLRAAYRTTARQRTPELAPF
jgi:hypothetical protein